MFDYSNGKWQNFIMNKIDLPYLFLDKNDNILFTNNVFLDLSGYKEDEIKNYNIKSLLNLEEGILSCKNNKKIPIDFEFYPLKSDSIIKNFLVLKSQELVIQTEILKEDEEEFKEKYHKFNILFESLFDFIPQSIALINKKGYIINCNLNLCKLIDDKKEDLIGKSILHIFEKKDFFVNQNNDIIKFKNYDDFLKYFEDNKSGSNRKFILDKRLIEIELKKLSHRLYLDDNKDDENFIIVFSESSEIYQKLKELEKNSEIFTNFFVNNPIPMCIVDFDGYIKETNKNFKFKFGEYSKLNIFNINKTFKKSFELLCKNIIKDEVVHIDDYFVKIDDKKKKLKLFKYNYSDYKKVSILIKLSKDFSEKMNIYSIYCFSLFNSIYPSYEDNLENSFVFIFIDITDQIIKRNEIIENMKDSKKLSKGLDLLINNINHEIRTPVNILTGLVELIKYENFNDYVKSDIDLIANNLEKIVLIIDEIISISSFSDRERNLMDVELKPIILDYLNYIESSCKFKIKTNNISEFKIKVKINLIIFKKLMNFLIEKFKNWSFLEFYLNLDFTEKKNLIIIKIRNVDDTINEKNIDEINLYKIIIKYLVMLLNGKVHFSNSSIYNFEIKIPLY